MPLTSWALLSRLRKRENANFPECSPETPRREPKPRPAALEAGAGGHSGCALAHTQGAGWAEDGKRPRARDRHCVSPRGRQRAAEPLLPYSLRFLMEGCQSLEVFLPGKLAGPEAA